MERSQGRPAIVISRDISELITIPPLGEKERCKRERERERESSQINYVDHGIQRKNKYICISKKRKNIYIYKIRQTKDYYKYTHIHTHMYLFLS